MPQINGVDFDDYLFDSVTIDEDNLNGEYTRVASDLAYWAKKHGEAELNYLAAKATIKRCEGVAYERARSLLEADASVAKVTEAKVEARAQQNADLEAAHSRFAQAAAWRKTVEGYADAVKTKRDMLISLGADLRKERETEPYLRDRG